MKARWMVELAFAGVMALVFAASGCGEPGLAEPGAEHLKVLDLSPVMGEMVTTSSLQVVAVFSRRVTVSTGSSTKTDEVNATTFYLKVNGSESKDNTVAASPLDLPQPADKDPQYRTGATVILTPNSKVTGAIEIEIAATIQGMISANQKTESLGEQIESPFTYQP